MAMDEGNSLAFFTANHSNHDIQWRMTGESISVVCVACLVELLENPEVRHIRKRKALREVIFLISRDQKVYHLLSQNTRVVAHLCGILMDLLTSENDFLASTVIETLTLVATRYCTEKDAVKIVEKLEATIISLNNLRKSYHFIVVLGKLHNSIPPLAQVTAKNFTILEYILSSISLPEENVQVALLYVILQICANEVSFSILNLSLKQRICKETCAVICSSSNSDVQANALGILRRLSSESDVLSCVFPSSGATKATCNILEGLKKVLLSTQCAIQAGGVQCIWDILTNEPQSNEYTAAILKSGIGEMLLEDLETTNEIILGSAFCCLHHIVQVEMFYSESYSVYGVESLILGVSNALKIKNHEVIRQGYCVLSVVLASHPKDVPLFANEENYKHCVMVLHEGLKSADRMVSLQAACAVEQFLHPQYLPPSATFVSIVPLLTTVTAQLQNFTRPGYHFRKLPRGFIQDFMCILLRITDKFFTFVEEYKRRKPSYETLLTQTTETVADDNENIHQFLQLLWKAIDQTCVPALMTNYESIENPDVYHSFYVLLLRSVSPESEHKDSFAKKFAGGSFIRLSLEIKDRFCGSGMNNELTKVVSKFLVELCRVLSGDRESEMEKFLTLSVSTEINSISTCLALLAQSSMPPDTADEVTDNALFDSQCFAIELLYNSFVHEAEFVQVYDLISSLHKYITFHSNLSVLPRVSLKHLLLLWVTCYDRLRTIAVPTEVCQNIEAGQEILVQGILNVKSEEFEVIYSHYTQLVEWIFRQEVLAKTFGREVLLCFLREESTKEHSNGVTLHSLLRTNPVSFRTFLSLIGEEEEGIVEVVVSNLETLFSRDSASPGMCAMASHVGEMFHKLFLSNKTAPLQDHPIFAMLHIMIAIQTKLPTFDQDVRLLHHVINLLTSSKAVNQSISVSVFNYINVILGGTLTRKDPRIAVLLLSNKNFCSYVQEVLNTYVVKGSANRDHSKNVESLLSSVLILISYLVISQKHATKEVDGAISLHKKRMMRLVNRQQNLLGLASLIFWDAIFRTIGQGGKLPVVLSDGTQETEGNDTRLSDTDCKVMLIYLQNCMTHDNETVRQCTVRCFESFLDYVEDAEEHASNPWSRFALESQTELLSQKVLTSSLVQFCALILRHTRGHHSFTDSLKDMANKLIIARILDVSFSEEGHCWHCVALLAQLQRCADLRLSAQQGVALLRWLEGFKDSLSVEGQLSSSQRPPCTAFCWFGDVVIADQLLKLSMSKDYGLLSSLIIQLKADTKKDLMDLGEGPSGCGDEEMS